MEDSAFTGPLFIVGRPRSGTKLLRSMLNEHPQVAIPISETNFIPAMLRRFGDPSPLENADSFDEFYRRFSASTFFGWRARHGVILTAEELRKRADLGSWASVFETIMKFYAPKPVDEHTIWGDKSPGYLTHISELASLFPSSRFVHIVRDPRDHSLSVREAWGKHLLRSAERWRREVSRARDDGERLEGRYLEVRFEELLARPDLVAADLCTFLGLDYDDAMTTLSRSHEDRGTAAGALRIVPSTQGRYQTELNPRQVRRIEEVVAPVAEALGYEIEFADRFRPLSPWRMNLYRIHDGVAMTWFYLRDRGPVYSLRHLVGRLSSRS